MNTMLDPRIVAARIHGPEALVQGATATPDAITPSSHGWRRMLPMSLAIVARKGSQMDRRWKLATLAAAGPYRIGVVQLKFDAPATETITDTN
jgi:hypothetical protein